MTRLIPLAALALLAGCNPAGQCPIQVDEERRRDLAWCVGECSRLQATSAAWNWRNGCSCIVAIGDDKRIGNSDTFCIYRGRVRQRTDVPHGERCEPLPESDGGKQ
jgi:hypothetical protein